MERIVKDSERAEKILSVYNLVGRNLNVTHHTLCPDKMENGKMRTRITPNTDIFQAVTIINAVQNVIHL